MKKLLCTILSLTLALSMVGCGDTTATQAEPTSTPEPTATIEPTPEPLHCDFDIAVEEYKKENGIDKFSADDEFDFYMTLYSQGIDPHGLECDNPLFAGYIKFHEAKGELNTTEPTKPTVSDGGYTQRPDGTVVSSTGHVPKKSDMGEFIPHDEVEQYIAEHFDEETNRQYKAMQDSGTYGPDKGFTDFNEVIQQKYYTTSSAYLSACGFNNIDECVESFINDQYEFMTRNPSQSTDNAY